MGIKTTVDEYPLGNIGRDALKSYNRGEMAKAEALLDEGDALYFSSKVWRRISLDHGDCYSYTNKSNTIRGRLALVDGDLAQAKTYLEKSAKINRSSSYSAFGPNMSLANDLLAKGETQAVFAYFDACKLFWSYGSDRMDDWEAQINKGQRPDFGGNMMY